MFHQVFCTELTGMFNDRAIPRALQLVSLLDSSCNAVAISSTAMAAIFFQPLSDCTSNEPVFTIFKIIFHRPLQGIGPDFKYFNLRYLLIAVNAESQFQRISFTSRARSFADNVFTNYFVKTVKNACARQVIFCYNGLWFPPFSEKNLATLTCYLANILGTNFLSSNYLILYRKTAEVFFTFANKIPLLSVCTGQISSHSGQWFC